MKKIIILMALLSFIEMSTYAQFGSPGRKHSQQPEPLDKDYFLNKSAKFETAGWITFGAGLALGVTGFLIYQNNINTYWGGLNAAPGALCMVLGGGAVITSIALFTHASNCKKKAMDISGYLQEEKFPYLQGSSVACRAIPALGIKINF